MSKERAKVHIKRFDALKQKRSTWNNHYEDLARVQDPASLGFVSQQEAGDRRNEDIFDGTPMVAARGLANAVGAMLRPEGQTWVEVKAEKDEDLDDEGRTWVSDANERLREALEAPRARFRQATGETDKSIVVLGTGVVFTGEQERLGDLNFQSIPLRDAFVFFADNGEAIGLYRAKTFTLRQAVKRFGEEGLSEKTRQDYNKPDTDLECMIAYLHVVVPREEGRADAILSRNLPVASIWIEIEQEHEAEVTGFHEFPYAVPRWDTSSGEDYGRSPGMVALPDSNTLQAMEETVLVAGQLAADPPLLVPNDGVFDAANSFPGGITYYDAEIAKEMGRIPIGPLETGAKLPITREMQNDKRQQVFAAFFRNVLNLPVEGPAMTAEEVRARKEEFIREIGPVFGRLETDYTAPMVERSFMIMLRAGQFGPIPDSLLGKRLKFEYESPVKRIRKQIEAAAARLWVQERIELAAVDPGAMDIVDLDEYGRFSADAAGVPDSLVRGEDAVATMRSQRAEEQARAKQMQTLMAAGQAGKDIGNIPGVKQMLEGQSAPA
jgi:hypothetical protein